MTRALGPEVILAKAVASLEPEKEVNGSWERRDWLRLVITVQTYLLTHRGQESASKFVNSTLRFLGVDPDA